MAEHDEVVLVTGYPGLQARRLLKQIVRSEPETVIYLVVLDKLLAKAQHHLATLEEDQRKRVLVLSGDAAAMDLGLSGKELGELARRVTRIHHVAYISYVGADREIAEYGNVQGAIEVVELAKIAKRLRCLVHHSTAHVSGDRTGTVLEDDLDCGQGFHSVSQQTRMKAEKVMRRAMPKVPIAVVRPTMMVGASDTGEADRFDGPYLLIMLILGLPADIAVPLPAAGDVPLNIVPVDFVVQAAHTIGRHPAAPGSTFHLASPEGLTAKQVFDTIARAGGRRTVRTFIPAQVANVLLGTPGVERLLSEPRDFLKRLATRARYDTRRADALLKDTDIRCPPLASYVDTLVAAVQDYLRERRRELGVDPSLGQPAPSRG